LRATVEFDVEETCAVQLLDGAGTHGGLQLCDAKRFHTATTSAAARAASDTVRTRS